MLKHVLALFLFLHVGTAAGQSGWYLLLGAGGGSSSSVGQDRASNNATLTSQGFGVLASREESDGTALNLGAGYRFTRNVALEVSFIDFSQLHYYSATYTTGPNFGSLSKQWSANGIEGAVIGAWPLNDSFSLIGKVGLLSMKGKYRTTTMVVSPPPNSVIVSQSENSASGSATVPGVGLGVSYTFRPGLSARVVYEGWGSQFNFGPGNELDRVRQLSFGLLLGH